VTVDCSCHMDAAEGITSTAPAGRRCAVGPGILSQERQEVVREKDGKTPRTAFAVHTYNDILGGSPATPG
jgi:hypothetical protein